MESCKVHKFSLGFDFWRAACLWRKSIESVLNEIGITHPQFLILYHLDRANDSSQNQKSLAISSGVDVATTSQIVRLLERKKLIKRKHTKNDERAKYVKLTLEGQKTLAKALEKYHVAYLNFFDPEQIEMTNFQQTLFALNNKQA
jgi:DNA-binding MarR family transcriptional regulator